MVALVVIAMFWGNCLSCPVMTAGSAHSCCHKPQPASAKCHSQNLQHFVQAEMHTPAIALPVEGLTADVWMPSWSHSDTLIVRTPPGDLIIPTALRI
jgi:hypothetical protein